MKNRILILILMIFCAVPLVGQHKNYGKGYYNARIEIADNGDSLQVIDMIPIYCFRKPPDMRKYARLVQNVKKVYPIAKEAKGVLAQMEEEILGLPKKSQKAYIKKAEKQIQAVYTPVIKKMTFSQGKILIKLIDRETDRTSYEIVKELRGGFRATFWQGVARIFGANLKDQYDKDGDDKVIEQIILLYEAGLL